MSKNKGYRGFESKKAYEEHYSDPANYADELPAMERYSREAEEERIELEKHNLIVCGHQQIRTERE